MMRLIFILALITASFHVQSQKMWDIGVAGEIEKDSLFSSAGFTYLIDNAGRLFSPKNISDEQFQGKLALIKASKIKLLGVNVFMPGDMKLVGPVVDEPRILEHATTIFKRCKTSGVKIVVWGSGGARRVPDGFDQGKARSQFIDIARKVSAIAKNYGIVLAFESLNSTETNFINTAEQALQLVKDVDHPSFLLNIDFYHMLMEGESPAIIEQAGKYVVHCELAEKEGRSAPGVHHQDFIPYFRAMKKINYKGKVIIECQWKDVNREAATAYQEIDRQIRAAFDDSKPSTKDGWQGLFDGRTLNGWNALPGGTWNVEGGILVGRSDPKEERHGILLSDKQYKNFEIEVVYKAIKGNSGLYFRTDKSGDMYGVLGFQAEIDPVANAGGVYETGGREWVSQPTPEEVKKYFKADDWNTMRVRAVDGDITVTVNGTTAATLHNDPGRKQGYFGLQLHGGQEMHVMFKVVKVKEL